MDCLRQLARVVDDDVIVVTSLGGVRVEWHTLRPSPLNFNVHNLGLASSVALGVAVSLPDRRVVCLDGDASLLFNLGSLATVAFAGVTNLVHIVFDNASHESCGGVPTATSLTTDLATIAAGAGRPTWSASTLDEFTAALEELWAFDTGGFLHCITMSVIEEETVPVPYDHVEMKHRFMRALPEAQDLVALPPPMHVVAHVGGK
jgi:thiamine pyrophosphate-dependent acetolactate synthase large subunit-like protein